VSGNVITSANSLSRIYHKCNLFLESSDVVHEFPNSINLRIEDMATKYARFNVLSQITKVLHFLFLAWQLFGSSSVPRLIELPFPTLPTSP
jgi:hypothetical protein